MPMPPQVETKWVAQRRLFHTLNRHREYFYNPAPYLPTLSFILPSAPSISPLPQRAATGSPSYAALFAQKFQEYIHPPRPKDGEPLAMPLASLRTDINWEDVRIQDWNGIEREENEEYLIKAGERATTLGMLQVSCRRLLLPSANLSAVTAINGKQATDRRQRTGISHGSLSGLVESK